MSALRTRNIIPTSDDRDIPEGLMREHFLNYYRCPDDLAMAGLVGPLSSRPGYFHWGQDIVCHGRTAAGSGAHDLNDITYNAEAQTELRDGLPHFTFDPEEITENLQRERYSEHFRGSDKLSRRVIRSIYYALRPYLSVTVRKPLQRHRLRHWDKIQFPQWPVDCTVDRIHQKRLALAMQAQGVDRVPFIWFWPDNYSHCIILTHDVEDVIGRDFCGQLMDLDDSFGFRSSFQVVPEERYSVSNNFLTSIQERGFEVNVHDLKHDGRLYAKHEEFRRRAGLINEYGRQFGAVGFRSGALYRNADWYDDLDFVYDMSIPNVGHLDPQRGGCCTVMPYFIGKTVELPLTCTQDYTLFHILRTYSLDLWKDQIERIRAHAGLVSVLVHPDYILEKREQDVYKRLMEHLASLRDNENAWAPLPRDVANWWHQRNQMRLVCEGGDWRIEGEGKERASIAWACLADGQVTFQRECEKVPVLAE
jgi:hypothetical protein